MEGESFNFPSVIRTTVFDRETGKFKTVEEHYPNAQSIVTYHIVNGKPIKIYDEETDSLKVYEPGHPTLGDNYYVVSSATYEMQGTLYVKGILFCDVECMHKEEFETRFADRYSKEGLYFDDGDPPRPIQPSMGHWKFDPYGCRGTHNRGQVGHSSNLD